MATQTFPKGKVIGCRFVAVEGYSTHRGIISDIIESDGVLQFHTRNIEDEHPDDSGEWHTSDESRVFIFDTETSNESWRYNSDGNIIITRPYIGSVTISIP